ncbi:hypothetical protein FOMA001_g8581 [Fusarium oxysporum f. sp. matthiolae]|nr:hypothetical protein FOMA001_g8581 [Fusarium oxysporum f. sp. matthiolae]
MYDHAAFAEDTSNLFKREAAIYEALGPHPCILKCIGVELMPDGEEAWALRLERAPHGDVSPRNVLVFDDLHIKLCDFAGSILKGKFPELLFTCEPRCWVPGPEGDSTTRSILEKELFALGTAICEITEWTVPYGPIEIEELQQKLMDGEYPYIGDSNHVKDVIKKLWHFEYSSAQEAVEALRTALDT